MMGYMNAAKIRRLEQLRRDRQEGTTAFAQAELAVDASQADCPHPREDIRRVPVTEREPGGVKSWCRRCSAVLERV